MLRKEAVCGPRETTDPLEFLFGIGTRFANFKMPNRATRPTSILGDRFVLVCVVSPFSGSYVDLVRAKLKDQ